MKVFAVIPAYNEEKTVAEVIRKTKKLVDRIILIDDFSKDKTGEIAKSYGAEVYTNPKNMGNGYSKRTGISKALELGADIIVTLDADLQHKPEDIPKLLDKLKEGNDFVIGERNIGKYPFVKRFGNVWLSLLTNLISGTNIKDTESGYQAFTREAAKKLNLKANRYAIQAEIIYELGRTNLKCDSVKIDSPIYRRGVRVIDGLKNFIFLLRKKFSLV